MIPSKIKIKILALRRIFAALGTIGLKYGELSRIGAL